MRRAAPATLSATSSRSPAAAITSAGADSACPTTRARLPEDDLGDGRIGQVLTRSGCAGAGPRDGAIVVDDGDALGSDGPILGVRALAVHLERRQVDDVVAVPQLPYLLPGAAPFIESVPKGFLPDSDDRR